MKAKHLSLSLAVLLGAGGLWLARSAWRTHGTQKPATNAGVETQGNPNLDPDNAASSAGASQQRLGTNSPLPDRMLRPPVPNRRFTDFTPEQRVQFARQGHGPGG
ncbi:MAG TPA: hypothetical protein VHI52_14490 [Verrucomicrobiae bacterium]|nr:hypothetical protein [Verrucomicrobiae bacterium]